MKNKVDLELRKYVTPEIILGLDARLLIGRYISHFNSKNPMIVTDQGVIELEWYGEILKEIEEYAESVFVFCDVTPNPKDYETMLGAELFLSHECDLIIAIGGGSPIDCAKGISIVSTNGGNILEYEGVDEIKFPGPPLICIPSTAGASADVSQFAIVTDTVESVKRAIISKKAVPDLALIDPLPLMTMSPYLTACTGMDALTHAIEAYASNAHSALTDVHALEAIKLINRNIENAVRPERSIETMYEMMLGSVQAGLAFSNASLGAVHAMAHSIGGFFDLPHGECNSILLEHIIELNFDSVPERFRNIGEQLGILTEGLSDIAVKEKVLHRIIEIRENLQIRGAIEIEELGEEVLGQLVKNALNDPCMLTNPKELSIEEVKGIYERILHIKK